MTGPAGKPTLSFVLHALAHDDSRERVAIGLLAPGILQRDGL